MLGLLVNGEPVADSHHAIDSTDRGLNYGDGLFETMRLSRGRVRLLQSHFDRLRAGCERLKIASPSDVDLRSDIERVCGSHVEGVVKLIVTRGVGTRGYRPASGVAPTRVVSLHALPTSMSSTLRARWCDVRLSRNPVLAGIKHLNRLEQVLAQSEWNDDQIEEGLLLDSEGELISATAANLFLVRGSELVTSDLRYCGVRGVMRAAVLRAAQRLGIPAHEEPLWPDEVDDAAEIFVTNAVRGVRSIVSLDARTWSIGEMTRALAEAVEADA